MVVSQKFKLLQELTSHERLKFNIPSFVKVNDQFDIQNFNLVSNKTYILRSALKNESCLNKLTPGKSLSIGGIIDITSFNEAFSKIKIQKNLDEVVLQEEVNWYQHLTIYIEKDFIFIDVKGGDFSIYGHGKVAGNTSLIERIRPLCMDIHKALQGESFLCEIGLTKSKAHIFQINEVHKRYLDHFIQSDLLLKLLINKDSQEKAGLWTKISNEMKAMRFRSKTSFEGLADAFLNWNYLNHYYHLFCRKNRESINDQSFVRFLTHANKHSNFLSEVSLKHIQIANLIRQKGECIDPVNTRFYNPSVHCYYLGSGQLNDLKKGEFLLINSLEDIDLYKHPQNIPILTRDSSLLSHGHLACVELKINLLSNISDTYWENLLKADKISIDFNKQCFFIE